MILISNEQGITKLASGMGGPTVFIPCRDFIKGPGIGQIVKMILPALAG